MSQRSTLHDFADVEPLKVKEKVPVRVGGSVLAWAGPSNREENVVVSQRHRYEYEGGKQDYFRKHSGYNYGDNALDVMEEMGATRIAVHEVDNNRILEFDVTQFRDSDIKTGEYEIGGQNYCVRVDDALHSWDRKACQITKDHV